MTRLRRLTPKARRSRSDDDKPRSALPVSPWLTRTNSTVESIVRDLEAGRGSLYFSNPEAGSLLGNWSHKRGKIETLSDYNSFWSGEPNSRDRTSEGGISRYTAGDKRFGMLLLVQPGFEGWMFDDATQNGFTARILFQSDDSWTSDHAEHWTSGKQSSDSESIRQFQITIADVRADMDVGAHIRHDPELDGPIQPRPILKLAQDASSLIRDFSRECAGLANEAKDTPWAQQFWGKAAEQAARVAANLHAYATWTGGADGLVISAGTTEDAIEVIKWFGAEIARVAPAAGQTDLVKDANRLSAHLWRAVTGRDAKVHPNQNATVSIGVVQSRRFSSLGKDSKHKELVLALLQTSGHVSFPGKWTQCYVNPYLDRVFKNTPEDFQA